MSHPPNELRAPIFLSPFVLATVFVYLDSFFDVES